MERRKEKKELVKRARRGEGESVRRQGGRMEGGKETGSVFKALNNKWRPAVFAVRRKLSTDLLCVVLFSAFSPFSASVSFQADSPLECLNTEEEEKEEV